MRQALFKLWIIIAVGLQKHEQKADSNESRQIKKTQITSDAAMGIGAREPSSGHFGSLLARCSQC